MRNYEQRKDADRATSKDELELVDRAFRRYDEELKGYEREEAAKACEKIDEDDLLIAPDKFNIAGTLAGIKPVSAFDFYVSQEGEEYGLESALENLGIHFTKESHESSHDSSMTHISYHIALDGKLLKEFEAESAAAKTTEEAIRVDGKYYGFPQTAIDYFVERANSDKSEDLSDQELYYMMIHSPEHTKEEFQQFEVPIMAAMQQYFPHSAEGLREFTGWPEENEN